MAIVKCCECGHDVSTFATCCQNCGCPVSVIIESNSERENKMYDIVLNSISEPKSHVIRFVREINSGSLEEAFNLTDNLPSTIAHCLPFDIANTIIEKLSSVGGSAEVIESDYSQQATDESKIKNSKLFTSDKPLLCPRCGSQSVTTGVRGYSIVSGLLGSNKTTNRCGKCGYSWKPR